MSFLIKKDLLRTILGLFRKEPDTECNYFPPIRGNRNILLRKTPTKIPLSDSFHHLIHTHRAIYDNLELSLSVTCLYLALFFPKCEGAFSLICGWQKVRKKPTVPKALFSSQLFIPCLSFLQPRLPLLNS